VGAFAFGGDELAQRVCETDDREYAAAFMRCSHTFDSPKNFSCRRRRVKILDYGEAGMENLFVRYGDRVEELLISVANGAT
jgi:hypothetical protein